MSSLRKNRKYSRRPRSHYAPVCNRVFSKALGKSNWITSAGGTRRDYFNIDKIFK